MLESARCQIEVYRYSMFMGTSFPKRRQAIHVGIKWCLQCKSSWSIMVMYHIYYHLSDLVIVMHCWQNWAGMDAREIQLACWVQAVSPLWHYCLQGVLCVTQASCIRNSSPCSPSRCIYSFSKIRHEWPPRLQNKANLRDLIAATGLVNFDAKIEITLAFFAHVTLGLDWCHRKTMRQLLYTPFKLCASFHSHLYFKLELSLGNSEIGVKLGNFLACVTFTYYRWHWKAIDHIFFTTPSCVHDSVFIFELNLDSLSGKPTVWVKLAIYWHVSPWHYTNDLPKQWGTSSMTLQTLCIIS